MRLCLGGKFALVSNSNLSEFLKKERKKNEYIMILIGMMNFFIDFVISDFDSNCFCNFRKFFVSSLIGKKDYDCKIVNFLKTLTLLLYL